MVNKNFLQKNLLPFIFLVSLTATFGSLFFSEVLKLPPCVLCWYQRITMYPIAIILGVGIFRKDKNAIYYTLPFSIIGLIFAAYHNLLYYKFIPEALAPCIQGITCTAKQLEWAGFITIPLLSLLGFLVILIFSLLHIKISKKN